MQKEDLVSNILGIDVAYYAALCTFDLALRIDGYTDVTRMGRVLCGDDFSLFVLGKRDRSDNTLVLFSLDGSGCDWVASSMLNEARAPKKPNLEKSFLGEESIIVRIYLSSQYVIFATFGHFCLRLFTVQSRRPRV